MPAATAAPPAATATPVPAATATGDDHPGGDGDHRRRRPPTPPAGDRHPGGDGDAAGSDRHPGGDGDAAAATAVATATATAGPITITPSKTLACGPTGPSGSFTGEVTVTVAGGQVTVLSYQDWIEYEVPGAPGTWARVPTTVQPEPPIAFPVTLDPGTYAVTYTGTYSGVPPEASAIRNVLILLTDQPGAAEWNELAGQSGAVGTRSDAVPPCPTPLTPGTLAAPGYTIDQQGADDEPGQKDLNFLTVDYDPDNPRYDGYSRHLGLGRHLLVRGQYGRRLCPVRHRRRPVCELFPVHHGYRSSATFQSIRLLRLHSR